MLEIFVPSISDAPFRLAGLVILIVWYVSVAKKQAAFVKQTFGPHYQKRSWVQPLLVGFACLMGIFVVAFVMAFAAEYSKRRA